MFGVFSAETSTPNQTATSATKTTNGEYLIHYKVALKLLCLFCYVYFANSYYAIHFSALVTAKPQDSSEGKTHSNTVSNVKRTNTEHGNIDFATLANE